MLHFLKLVHRALWRLNQYANQWFGIFEVKLMNLDENFHKNMSNSLEIRLLEYQSSNFEQ